jgi:hypothetical protein
MELDGNQKGTRELFVYVFSLSSKVSFLARFFQGENFSQNQIRFDSVGKSRPLSTTELWLRRFLVISRTPQNSLTLKKQESHNGGKNSTLHFVET